MHLIFLIHGLFGNPGHLNSMADSLNKALDGSTTTVHRATCMSAVGTFDGVIANAHKLERELYEQLRKTGATRLSIVGYSLGGLCGRYLAGMLGEAGVFDRIEPVVFATFATPHVGTRFPDPSWFGKLFDFVGSRITGVSGQDLFGVNDLLTELADPELRYHQALRRFSHLMLFANSSRDRTVPFWTSYITTVDPFRHRSHVEIRRHSDWRFVDLRNSTWREVPTERPRRTCAEWAKLILISILLPMFLVILVTIMSSVTLLTTLIRYVKRSKIGAFFYQHINQEAPDQIKEGVLGDKPNARRSSMGDELMGSLGEAVAEALELTSRQSSVEFSQSTEHAVSSRKMPLVVDVGSKTSASSQLGLPSPGFAGLIESCPLSLDLPAQTKVNIHNLNQLPWMKYAVRLPSINAHGIIVDRNNRGSEGKGVLDFFAAMVASITST